MEAVMPTPSKSSYLLDAIRVRVRGWLKAGRVKPPTDPTPDNGVMDLKLGLIGHSMCGLGAGPVYSALIRYRSPRATHHGRPGR